MITSFFFRQKRHFLLAITLIFLKFLQICSLETIPDFDFATTTLYPKKTGFLLSGYAAGNYFGFTVKSAGDINKDGYPDIIVGAPNFASERGVAFVFFGGPTNGFDNIDLSTTSLNPASTGIAIWGQTAGDHCGYSVSGVGDINGDNIDDIVIGANSKSGNQGVAYVIYGKQTWTGNIDLVSTTLMPQSTGFTITGAATGDQLGFSVSAAGDMNRDGYNDILLGASTQTSNRGAAYVVYGGPTISRANIFLSTDLIPSTTGFKITGAAVNDNMGFAVALAGDVNGDGWKDIVVGAQYANGGKGRVYVIFNTATPANINLNIGDTFTGFTVTGEASSNFGFAVSSAGDINGDGKTDILVGAWAADSQAGAAYVIYGKTTPPNLDISAVGLDPGNTGFKVWGANPNDHLGSAVSAAGDLNGDGLGDILVGADWFGGNKGAAYVIYGKSSPSDILLATPLVPASTGFTITGGTAGSNNLGFGLGVADVNNDGFQDLLVGAYKQNSGRGAVYVIHTACMTAHCVSCANKVCTSCDGANGWFLSGTACVTSCPVQTYASIATGKCEACLTNCDVCSGSSTCSTCTAGNFLYQGSSCGSTCPLTFYGNAGVCLGCPTDCDTCSSGTVCSVCTPPKLLHLSGCVGTCPTKFYPNSGVCSACPGNCDTCTSGSVCTYCSVSYFLSGSSCTQNCPLTTYSVTATRKCEACPANCNTCSSGTICTACTPPYFLDQALSSCTLTCPIRFFGSTSSWKCEACPSNCDWCTDSSTCTTCTSPYFLDQALSSCTLTCPIRTYGSTSSWKCEACPSNCDWCTDSSTCTTCTSPYFLDQALSSCTLNCPTRFFGSTTSWKCESCSAGCLECTSATVCQVCDQFYALVNDACEVCPVNCDVCTSSVICSTCTSPYFLSSNWCLPTCPNATFAETATGRCEGCPAHCARCTSLSACQACDEGYIKGNASSCVLPPIPTYPKTESTATKAITSSVTAAGSLACVGSVTFPQTTLVSKIVQNMRYINLTVTADLAEVYQTWSTNLIDWDFPNFLEDLDDFREAPRTFSQYSLDSPFLANFWSTLMTLGVSIGTLIGCFMLKILFERSQYKNSWVYRLLQKLVLGAFNFALVQVYGCVDDILFYLVLDTKGNPFNSSYDWGSIICASLFLAAGCYLIYFNFRIVRNYQRIKTKAKAKKDNDAIEAFNESNKYWELFYSDFNDTDVWSQSTLALLVNRSVLSSFIIAVLYGHPLVQMILLIILDAAMMLFLILKNPFTTLRGKLTQYYFETITLLVHLIGFILSFQRPFQEFSESVLTAFCTSIIYLNMCLMIGSVGFMFIELYKTISQKIKLKRVSKYETIAVQTGCDESYNETQKTSFSGSPEMIPKMPARNTQIERPRISNWVENRQFAPSENNYSNDMSILTEENNSMSFTGVNLLHFDSSNSHLPTDDFVLQQDFDRNEMVSHQRGRAQSRFPMMIPERNGEIQHQRGQTGIPITTQNRRRNIKKRLPADLITL